MPNGSREVDPARRTLLLSSLGFFLITLDILIVNLALPDIQREFTASTSALQWIVDGYTLPFAALLLLAGNLSERWGAKHAFGWGIALFGIASVACALAPNVDLLVGARVLQGASAALMLPASMALIRQAFTESGPRARALGIWASGGAIASGLGPLVGGALATVDWRLVFVINVPACVVMLLLFRRVAPSPSRATPFDWAGQVLSVVALTALVWALIEGGEIGYDDPFVVTAFIVGAITIVGFVWSQSRVRHPMMPLTLFSSSGMRISVGIGLAFMVGNFGMVFVVSLFLQQQVGLNPLLAGLVFLPSSAASFVGNTISGRLVNRFGPRVPIVVGLLMMAAGLSALASTAHLESPLLVGALLFLVNPGGAIAMPAVTSVVLDSTPAERAGTASAVFNTFRQIGGALAIAVFGSVLAIPAGLLAGAQISLFVAAAAVLLAALSALRIRSASIR